MLHSLPIQLLRAREGLMARFRPQLRRHHLTDQQWRILRALAEADGMDMQALAIACQVQPPSLSRIVPRLEQRGLVARSTADADQRRSVARLTRKGRSLFARASAETAQVYAELTAQLGPARVEALLRALDDVIAAVERPTA